MRALLAALTVSLVLIPLASSSPAACTRQADGTLRVSVTGCSMDAAYALASLGETVLMEAGDYPLQVITDKAGKDTTGDAPDVVFQPMPGAVVRVNGLRLGSGVESNDGPDHITVRGITGMPGSDLFIGGNDANDITVEGYSARSFYINGAQSVTVSDGRFGPSLAPGPNSKVDGNPANRDIHILRNEFFGYQFGPSCFGYGGQVDCHHEALFLAATGPGFLLEGNRFHNNWIYHVFVQPNGAASGIIQNNWFGVVADGFGKTRESAITFGGCASNWLVRFNSLAPGQRVVDEGGGCLTNVRSVGNIIGGSGCDAGIASAYNLILGGACSATDRSIAVPPYVDASGGAAMDYHLVPGSTAEGFVTQTGADFDLATDFDGQARSAPRDAGSDESGAAPPPPLSQCADGLDNDGDGKTDLADPGCSSASDDDETDAAPPTTACSDGIDNDHDGKIDLLDPGCTDAADDSESPDPPPPPPTCTAPLLSAGPQTDQTSTVLWASVAGATGYKLYKDGVVVATTGPLATSTKFGKLKYGLTPLGVAALCPDGEKLSGVSTTETRVLTVP